MSYVRTPLTTEGTEGEEEEVEIVGEEVGAEEEEEAEEEGEERTPAYVS